jgi:hypothetical protein
LKQNAGIEFGLGGIQWELAGCLLLSWLLVYVIICKGLHSSGKVILNLISTFNRTFFSELICILAANFQSKLIVEVNQSINLSKDISKCFPVISFYQSHDFL